LIKEAIGFGSTIEEAKEDAIAKLGASEFDDIQLEVLAMPKKKVLGMFGGADAQVKAYIEIAEKKNKNVKKQKANNQKEKPSEKKENKKEKNLPKKSEEAVKTVTEDEELKYGEAVDAAEISADTPAGKAIEYIKTVLSAVNCENVEIKVASRENASLIIIDGEDISILIGRRGETLDALQYLASLAANNGGGHYKISLNIGNYREKRAETLSGLAKRISAQVLKTGKSRTLEPMNPYERRIIHATVQGIDGVLSNSFGDGVGRRVVVSPEGAEVKPPRFQDRRRNGNRRSSRSSAQVNAVAREPKKDSDIPLYGKIN